MRTARCEALLEPLDENQPGQSTTGSGGATNVTARSIGKNTTINTTADGLARSKLRWESMRNPVGLDLIEQVQQMQIEMDAIKGITN